MQQGIAKPLRVQYIQMHILY